MTACCEGFAVVCKKLYFAKQINFMPKLELPGSAFLSKLIVMLKAAVNKIWVVLILKVFAAHTLKRCFGGCN